MGLRKRVSDALYQVGPGRYYQPTYRRIAETFSIPKGVLLDLGCGPGWVSVRMAERESELSVVGIDHSREMVAAARRNGGHIDNLRFDEMDSARMTLQSDTIDRVIAVQTAHHWVDPDAVLAEVARVLKPAGRLLLLEADRHMPTVPSGWIERSRVMWPPDVVVKKGWRRFGMDDQEWATMTERVHNAGMAVVRDSSFGFYRCMEVRCGR